MNPDIISPYADANEWLYGEARQIREGAPCPTLPALKQLAEQGVNHVRKLLQEIDRLKGRTCTQGDC